MSPAYLPWQEECHGWDPAWVPGLELGNPRSLSLECCAGDRDVRVLVAQSNGATATGDYVRCNLGR